MNFDASLALRADGLLGTFNQAGILSAADVHVARRLGAIADESSDAVLLAVALVVRSTRHGSVVVDLDTAEATTSPDVDEEETDVALVDVALDWPTDWVAQCAASPLVGSGGPVRMLGSQIWLGRLLGPGGAGRARAARTIGVPPLRSRPCRLVRGSGPAVQGRRG